MDEIHKFVQAILACIQQNIIQEHCGAVWERMYEIVIQKGKIGI